MDFLTKQGAKMVTPLNLLTRKQNHISQEQTNLVLKYLQVMD